MGFTLLEAWDCGALDGRYVAEAATSLLDTPTVDGGGCVAASMSEHDAALTCAHNINAHAAWFLGEADAREKAAAWLDYLEAAFEPELNGWPYLAGDTALQDSWHNASAVYVAWRRLPKIGPAAMAGQWAEYAWSGADAEIQALDCQRLDETLEAVTSGVAEHTTDSAFAYAVIPTLTWQSCVAP